VSQFGDAEFSRYVVPLVVIDSNWCQCSFFNTVALVMETSYVLSSPPFFIELFKSLSPHYECPPSLHCTRGVFPELRSGLPMPA